MELLRLAALSSWTAFEEFCEEMKPNLLAWFREHKQFFNISEEAA
jgi:hypothetical protein